MYTFILNDEITVKGVQTVNGKEYSIIYSNNEVVRVTGQTAQIMPNLIKGWYSYYPHNSNIIVYIPNRIVKG